MLDGDPVELPGVLPAPLGIEGGRDVEGEDQRVDAPFAEAGEVDVAVGRRSARLAGLSQRRVGTSVWPSRTRQSSWNPMAGGL